MDKIEERQPWKVNVHSEIMEVPFENEDGSVQMIKRRVNIPQIVKTKDLQPLELPFRGEGVALTIGNRKGGAGKTSTSMMLAYSYAKMGIKVLFVDLDSQANATKTMALTHDAYYPENPFTIRTSLMGAVQQGSLENSIENIIPNLDLVSNYKDFENFAHWLYRTYQTENYDELDMVFARLFAPIRHNYDLIIFDTPPASKEIQRNVLAFSDFVVIALQTHERSMTGAEDYIEQIQGIKEQHDLDVMILGILPIMFDDTSVDRTISEAASEQYGGEVVFQNIIRRMERVKGFDLSGIIEVDMHDTRTVNAYNTTATEILERLIAVW